MNQAYVATGAAGGGAGSVTIKADARGHFIADAQVNGGAVRFLVDTGATTIALPAADAKRLGINYLKGERGMVQTANGTAPAYRVKLDTVRLGDITLNGVDGVVLEGGLHDAASRHELPQPHRDEARRRDDGAHQALLAAPGVR